MYNMVLIIKTYLKLCGISLWSNYPDDSLWIDLYVLNVMNHSVPIIQNNINFTVNFLPFSSIFYLLMGGGQFLLILLFICKFKRKCFQQENVVGGWRGWVQVSLWPPLMLHGCVFSFVNKHESCMYCHFVG